MAYSKYKPSGKASAFGMVRMFLFGLIGAILLLMVELHAVNLMPNLGLRVLVFLVVLYLLARFMRSLAKSGKVRSPGKAFWLTFLIMLIAIYIYAAAYVMVVYNAWEFNKETIVEAHFSMDTLEKLLYLLIHPKAIIASFHTILTNGFFSVRGVTISHLYQIIIWIAKGLLFLLVPSFRAMTQAFRIFSEDQRQWLDQTIELTCAYIKEHRMLRRQLLKGDVSGLDDIHYYKVQGQEAHGTITFYHHKGVLSPYVSIQMIKAVQIGPTRMKHFYIPILEQWDIGSEKEEEIFNRLLAESGRTREKVAGKRNFKERLFWRSNKELLAGTLQERVERSRNRVEFQESGNYKPGEETAGIEEVTVYSPMITPEMEQEYLARKEREEQEKIWAKNREEVKNRGKKKSRRHSTRIK